MRIAERLKSFRIKVFSARNTSCAGKLTPCFRCPRGWEQTADRPPLRQGEAEAEAEAGLQGSGSQACLTRLPSYICTIIHPE
jgi:hypothetical protein